MTDLRTALEKSRIPERMHGGIIRYVERGIRPGHFLCAVIGNDLKGACERADDENAVLLLDYVRLFYNYTPGGCWGSPENLEEWIKQGGQQGEEP